MYKKIMSVVMAIMMFFMSGVHSTGAQTVEYDAIMPRNEYTAMISTYLDITDGVAVCEVFAMGYHGIATKITVTINLQKKVLFWWTTEGSWTETFENYEGGFRVTTKVNKGTYRIKADIITYSGDIGEEATVYGSETEY